MQYFTEIVSGNSYVGLLNVRGVAKLSDVTFGYLISCMVSFLYERAVVTSDLGLSSEAVRFCGGTTSPLSTSYGIW